MLGEKIRLYLEKLVPYAYLLCLGAGAALLGCVLYCMTMWMPMGPPTLIMPDIGLICGIYCGTRIPVIGILTILTALTMITSGIFLKQGKITRGVKLAVITGILSIPVGVLPLIAAYLARQQTK